MRRPEALIGPAFAIAGGLYLYDALALPIGTARLPGPALYPLLVGGFTVVTALALSMLPAKGESAGWPDRKGFVRVAAVAAAVAGFCLAFPRVGYLAAMFGVMAVAVRLYGARGWLRTGVLAALFTAASYYLFAIGLAVPLEAVPRWR